MSYNTFVCPTHNESIDKASAVGCSGCNAQMDNALKVEAMTTEQRVEELRHWSEHPMTVPFSRIHGRIEALVGRPVWTHELVRTDDLIAEIVSGYHPTDLRRHAIETACDAVGTEKVFVLEEPERGEEPNA